MLVLGIGNILLQDDGIGIHVLRFMEKYFPTFPDVLYKNASVPNMALIREIGQHDHLLLLEAVELNAPPGTLCYYENEAMDRFLEQAHHTLHQPRLRDLLTESGKLDAAPRHRALVGIQYGKVSCGREPSVAVKANIPLAGRMAANILQKWEVEEHLPCRARKVASLRLVAG